MTRGVEWSPLEMKGIDVAAVWTAGEPAAEPSLVDKLIPGRRGERVKASQLELLSNRNQGESTPFEGQPGSFSSDNNSFGAHF